MLEVVVAVVAVEVACLYNIKIYIFNKMCNIFNLYGAY